MIFNESSKFKNELFDIQYMHSSRNTCTTNSEIQQFYSPQISKTHENLLRSLKHSLE